MFDPRIYRTGLIVGVLALVVLAFSLGNQQGALAPTLAPDAFNGQHAYATMQTLAAGYPSRRPGSAGDEDVATQVANAFRQDGFEPTTTTFSAPTVGGTQPLENVVGVRPGMKSGSIVIVASRDALRDDSVAGMSGTATLMELASDLSGETLNRTIALASTSGSDGAVGAARLAATLPRPIDAVVVLGDLAGTRVQQPIVLPWSRGGAVAPPALRNTVASALAAQTPFNAAGTGLGGQFAHLAFPFTLGQQGPFGAQGIPAVQLSLTGESPAAADTGPTSQSTLTAMGRAALETVSALDGGPGVPGPSSYLLLSGKVVPGGTLSLFALALLVPVLLTAIDGAARARRRGHRVGRWVMVMLAAAIPFLLAALVVVVARLVGALGVAPPGPVAAGTVPLGAAGIAVLAVAALVAVGSGAAVAQYVRRRPVPMVRTRGRAAARDGESVRPGNEGAAAGLLLVLCGVTALMWLTNPFAALLLIPALHLWLWAVEPDRRLPTALRAALILLGVAPAAVLVLYYANALGYGPLGAVWQAALLLAGHAVSLMAVLEWSLGLGCLVGAGTLAALAARRSAPAPAPITVRGPVTYAGPGSLGGTKSALRR